MSDPADMTAPRDPLVYRAGSGVRPAVVAVIAVVCGLGGAGLAALGGQLLARSATAPSASLSTDHAAPPSAALAPIPPVADAATPPSVLENFNDLDARLARLESHDRVTAQAAAQALAAAGLADAVQTSRPFPEELAAVRLLAPPSPELAQLARYAETGAPSRTALAAGFPDFVARASAALQTPGEDAGLAERIGHAVAKIITLRRTGPISGAGPEAQLSRVEQLVTEGDIDHALQAMDKLPPSARQALAPWREGAEHRAEVDRAVAALRARALQAISAAARDGA